MLDPTVQEWLQLILRWAHVITGIAWIGSSFFFMYIDAQLEKVEDPTTEGELWMVHSGGYYQFRKRIIGKVPLPARLHWVWLEATMTWVTGFLLLWVVFYLGQSALLVPAGSDLSQGMAVAIGLGVLAGGWLVYDLIWTSFIARLDVVAVILTLALLLLAAWALPHLLAPRAALLHVGALIGTCMAANVWVRIIPAQRHMMKAVAEGTKPDLSYGAKAKQRSVHNNYATLPVILIMLSAHFPILTTGPHPWAVLAALAAIGGVTRHWFNLKNKGKKEWWPVLAAFLGLLALIAITAPGAREGGPGGGHVPFAVARRIVATHCAACHSAHPSDPDYGPMVRDVHFDTDAQIRAHAPAIAQQLEAGLMPLIDKRDITDEERQALLRWARDEAGN